jgi:hypothetical protein
MTEQKAQVEYVQDSIFDPQSPCLDYTEAS